MGIMLKDYITREGNMVKICLYSPEAQQFIFDNIDSVTEFVNAQSSGCAENSEEE